MSVVKFDKYLQHHTHVRMVIEGHAVRINIIKELRAEFGGGGASIGLKEAKDMVENGAIFPNTPTGAAAAIDYMGRISTMEARGILPGFKGFLIQMWEAPYRAEPYSWLPADL